jgi:hypothetical protein
MGFSAIRDAKPARVIIVTPYTDLSVSYKLERERERERERREEIGKSEVWHMNKIRVRRTDETLRRKKK